MTPHIEIGKGKKKIGASRPHFWEIHDKYVREVDGEPVYELPLQEIVEYVASQEATPLLREAIQRIIGSHGLHTQFHKIVEGSTDPVDCFLVAQKDGQINPCVHKDWVECQPWIFGILLGDTLGHTMRNHSAEIQEISKHQTAICKMVGLEPNIERLRQELCTTCGK